MRSLSMLAISAIYAANTAEIFVHLLEISHPDVPTMRYVNQHYALQHLGNTFEPRGFIAYLPPEGSGIIPRVNIAIDNTDLEISDNLRKAAATVVPTVIHKVVLKSQPDSIECGPFKYKLKEPTYDRGIGMLPLSYEDFLNLSFPALEFRPDTHPALFGRINT